MVKWDRLADIVEWIPDGVYVVDGRGVTLLVNSAYEALSGTHRRDLIGRHMNDLVTEGYIDQSVSLQILQTKQPMSLMQHLHNGKQVIVTGNPVFDASGDVRCVVTSVRDITELNTMSEELDKAMGLSALLRHQYSAHAASTASQVVMESQHMQEIVSRVSHIAAYPTSVLLYGPSGVGKEVVANLIHDASPRSQKPFVKVNCAAIPDALMESELFGYEGGAFTGARREGKAGLLELADQGTILLDEVGELSLATQAKLLRVLQDFQVLRVGGVRPNAVDIRVISATNQDLRARIREGRFREDLYYRLQVVELQILPLSERREDAVALVDYYFAQYCARYRVDKRMSPEARGMLGAYRWPGNAREVKNLMENLVVSVPALLIEPIHLPLHVQQHDREGHDRRTLKEQVEAYERHLVEDTLRTATSIRQAANILGVDHSTLVKKLQRWRQT